MSRRRDGMPIRIFIADDDAVIRGLVRRIVEEHSEWLVCGEAENGFDAVAQVRQLAPDVVVMDLAMPRMNGIQAAREISMALPELPMLLLTVQQVEKELAHEARHAGFRGAVSKSTGAEVIRAIEALLRNGTYFAVDGTASVA
jgi:DNA-binding NarL/FixJ family response regulator